MTVSRNRKLDTPTPTPAEIRKIVYPHFSECAQFTLDPYWRQVFEECAKGHFPRGSGINPEGDVIYFRGKNLNNRNYVSYRLSTEPETTFKELKQYFQSELGLRSKQDRKKIRDEIDEICEGLQKTFIGSWQNIKKKKIRDPIIRKYILELKHKYELSDKETAEVAQMVKLGFLFNWITNEQVDYEDQCIKDITSLHFDEKTRRFHLEEPDVAYKREYKPKIQKLSTLWVKHLQKPKNRYML